MLDKRWWPVQPKERRVADLPFEQDGLRQFDEWVFRRRIGRQDV